MGGGGGEGRTKGCVCDGGGGGGVLHRGVYIYSSKHTVCGV